MSNFIFSFDVESNVLHGEGFAVGYVVLAKGGDGEYSEVECDIFVAPTPAEADVDPWVAANVLDALPMPSHPDARTMRSDFWDRVQHWRRQGAIFIADCNWPVEAGFLIACVQDAIEGRAWKGPYPMHEVATMRLAAGLDPLGTNDRLEGELPKHHPTADARQSARLWVEAKALLDGRDSK